MRKYVVGFAFDDADGVLLIKKNRPEWQRGLLNGVGGHIEEGESPVQAMRREAIEEAGVDLEWEQYALLSGINNDGLPFELHVFRAHLSSPIVHGLTDEGLLVFAPWRSFADCPHVQNLEWLIPAAFNRVVIEAQYGTTLEAERDQLRAELAAALKRVEELEEATKFRATVNTVQSPRLCSYFTSVVCSEPSEVPSLDTCRKCSWLESRRNLQGWIVYPNGAAICPDCRENFGPCQDRRHAPDCVRRKPNEPA